MHFSHAFLYWLYAGVLGMVGLAIGSFLNVVAYRVPLGISIIHPPSSCPSCGKPIADRDNIPLLGWLLLGGRCRNCRSAISPRYPLVELATGVLWGFAGWRLAGLDNGFWTNVFLGVLYLAFVSAMVVTVLVDWDYQIILDEISLGGTVIALIAAPFLPVLHHAGGGGEGGSVRKDFARHYPFLDSALGDVPAWVRSLSAAGAGVLAGLLLSLGIYYFATIVFHRQIEEAQKEDPEIDSALGLGDVKLMAFFGAFLGWQAVFFIFFGGSILGAAGGSVMRLAKGDSGGLRGFAGLRHRWQSTDSIIPFGPFLVAAALIYFFWGELVITTLTRYA